MNNNRNYFPFSSTSPSFKDYFHLSPLSGIPYPGHHRDNRYNHHHRDNRYNHHHRDNHHQCDNHHHCDNRNDFQQLLPSLPQLALSPQVLTMNMNTIIDHQDN